MHSYNSCSPTRPHNRRGFSLVEMLVVLGIIVLLISILMPALNRVRDQAKTAACLNNLRQIGIAFSSYATSNDGFMPPSYEFDLGRLIPDINAAIDDPAYSAKRSRWLYRLGVFENADGSRGPPRIWADFLMDFGAIDDADTFRCPSGIEEQLVGPSAEYLVKDKSLDYGINGYINQSGIDTNVGNIAWCGGGRLIGRKTSADTNWDGMYPQFNRFSPWPRVLITRPAEGMLVMDNLGGTLDGSAPRVWSIDASKIKPGQFRHLGGKSTNVLYFDGHAESRIVMKVAKNPSLSIFDSQPNFAANPSEMVWQSNGFGTAANPRQLSPFWRPWAPFFK